MDIQDKCSENRRPNLFDLEVLETRVFLSSTIRSINGSGNNVANPTWGSSYTDLLRLTTAAYADGVSSPSLPGDQSARTISNILNNQADPSDSSQDIQTVDQNSLSDFGYAFGQFMDHDMDMTPDGGESFPIAVSATDPIGPGDVAFTRSLYDALTGTSTSNPRQQVTDVTSYLDLSQVYGSTQTVADALRTFVGGQLKTSPGNMLPYDNTTYFTTAQITALNMENDSGAVPQKELFATGDVRGNENIELTALQTLFLRNHNLLAAQLQKEHAGWTDEQLYQEARKLNIAEYQNIIYSEWIPDVFGAQALPAYTGYKANVNATIANEFSTVAFRFGHSMVSPEIGRETNDGLNITDAAGSSISLANDFFDPNLLNPSGVVDPLTGQTSTDIDPILKGDADGDGQAMDMMAISDIRNLLFGNGGEGGDDLIARDVQRGRDNGIPDYNTLRVDMGLSPVTSFSQITSDVTVQHELEEAYPGGVNTIDAFEGGLAEDHVKGSDVGPLFQAIMLNQFTRLRDGDRFFYKNESFNADEMRLMGQGMTLTSVIEANTGINNLQADAFIFRASISGRVVISPPTGQPAPPDPGIGGVTVELKNSSGDVVATVLTNAQGAYTFNQLSGPAGDPDSDAPGLSATGDYTVVLAPSALLKQPSPIAGKTLISRGDTNVNNVNIMVQSTSPTPPPAPAPPHAPPPPGPAIAASSPPPADPSRFLQDVSDLMSGGDDDRALLMSRSKKLP